MFRLTVLVTSKASSRIKLKVIISLWSYKTPISVVQENSDSQEDELDQEIKKDLKKYESQKNLLSGKESIESS